MAHIARAPQPDIYRPGTTRERPKPRAAVSRRTAPLHHAGLPWINSYMSCSLCVWRAQRSVRASVAIA